LVFRVLVGAVVLNQDASHFSVGKSPFSVGRVYTESVVISVDDNCNASTDARKAIFKDSERRGLHQRTYCSGASCNDQKRSNSTNGCVFF
jgi:hypothetical protein